MYTMVGIIIMIVIALVFGLYSGARSRQFESDSEKEIDISLPIVPSSKKKK